MTAVYSPTVAHLTPLSVFVAAQDSIAHRDWARFFDCFDAADLRRFSGAALAAYVRELGWDDPWLERHCDEHGVPVELFEAGREDEARAALARLHDPAGFVAPLVGRVQAAGRWGAISTTLFLGESLEGLVVEEGTACATRTMRGASLGLVKFVRRAGAWLVRMP